MSSNVDLQIQGRAASFIELFPKHRDYIRIGPKANITFENFFFILMSQNYNLDAWCPTCEFYLLSHFSHIVLFTMKEKLILTLGIEIIEEQWVQDSHVGSLCNFHIDLSFKS